MARVLLVVLCVLASATPAQEPLTLTAQQDRQLMLDLLKIPAAAMRRGPSGSNRADPNYQNTDEAKANPWPNLPQMMMCKDRTPVTTPELWWNKRRPEIVEYFDAEVYGRVPKDMPKVTWTVTDTKNVGTTIVKTLAGQVDNSDCP